MKRLISTIVICLFLLIVSTIQVKATSLNAGCVGSGCNSLNPNTMGCDADAWAYGPKYVNQGYLELKLSPTCQAAWSKIANSGSSRYLGATLWYNNYLSQARSNRSPAAVPTGSRIYSSMQVDDTLLQACGNTNTGGLVTIPVSKSTSACTLVFSHRKE